MPALCSLRLDVYLPGGIDIDWSVSTDPEHVRPYLIAPQNYDGQEIDPITGAASIGTVDVGVIDVPIVAGDQSTGWMTARIGSIRGRRCVLRRYFGGAVGWILVADGPAGTPRLDASYSAYRWPIRDTREIERKLRAFNDGRSTAIVPFGAIEGFGAMPDDEWLMSPIKESAAVGVYGVNEGSQYGFRMGYVEFPWTDETTPTADLVIGKDGEAAVQTQGDGSGSQSPNADVLWRVAGDDDWNVARPRIPAPFVDGQLPFVEVDDGELLGDDVRAVRRVILWAKPIGEASDGTEPFDADSVDGVGESIEVIVRHRGKPTEQLPYYYEGTSGGLLADMYRGYLSGRDPYSEAAAIAGELYDPAGLQTLTAELAGSVRYDADRVALLTAPVLVRETDASDDARDWSERKIYAPSGWIPALDSAGLISPVSRARPSTVDGPALTDARTEPSPDWNGGEMIVTSVEVAYNRYFMPVFSNVAVEDDGLAIRPISIKYIDPDAQLTEGEKPVEYDGTAFSSVGDSAGNVLPDADIEPGSLLAQEARFEVLGRYRAGAQSMRVRVRRAEAPNVRAGDWCPAELSWFPNTETGLRGLAIDAVQVLSINDSECAWRYLLIEESPIATPPGYFDSGEVLEDEAGAGYFDSPEVLSDEPSP